MFPSGGAAAAVSRARIALRDLIVRRPSQLWPWLLPVAVFEVIHHYQGHLQKPFELLFAVPFVVLVARHPYKSLSVLLVLLPFNTFILAVLFRLGLPASVVWAIGFWKEGVLAGLVAAAVFRTQRSRTLGVKRRLDAVDKLVGAYVLLGTAYLFVPELFIHGAVGAHLGFYLRELGWRTDVLYFALLLVGKHLVLNLDQVHRLLRKVVAVGVVLSLGGIYEFFFTNSWLRFILVTLRLRSFDIEVLKFPKPSVQENYATLGARHFPRVSSFLLFDYLSFGFLLIICLGIALELVVRGEHKRWFLAGLPLIALGILLNQGRAAIIGAILTTIFALRVPLGRSVIHRVRLTMAVAMVFVIAIPLSLVTGLDHRFVSSNSSNSGHSSATSSGLHVMATNPLGRGLGTGAGAGQAAVQKGQITSSTFLVSEDQLLQIGTQLGYLGVGLYGISLGVILYRLARRRPDPLHSGYGGPAAGLANGLVGLTVAIFVLQPFVVNAVDWTFFLLAGTALGLLDRTAQLEPARRVDRPALVSLEGKWN